ncbi:MAG: hypothetical protein ACYTF1_02960 [Planctomycetota bacterium]|jgi:glucan phosphoethanolaminetransferase (alkaline phosphatase superfamily)
MSEEGFDREPVSPVVPPTEPGQMVIPPRPSSWATVIGIIAIVLGALGILGVIWGAIASYFAESMMPMMSATQRAELIDSMKEYELLTMVNGMLGLVVAVLLLIAGIGLIKRRPWSPKLCKTWAVLKMVVAVIGMVVGIIMQQSTFEAMSQQSNVPGFGQWMFVGMLIGTCFGLIWGWALPVFMLIWFSRRKIKEEVVSWE